MRQTQADIIRAHLMTGATISTIQAFELYNITCLTTRISGLRQAGLPIQSESLVHNGKRFNIYWLNSDDIQAHKAERGANE